MGAVLSDVRVDHIIICPWCADIAELLQRTGEGPNTWSNNGIHPAMPPPPPRLPRPLSSTGLTLSSHLGIGDSSSACPDIALEEISDVIEPLSGRAVQGDIPVVHQQSREAGFLDDSSDELDAVSGSDEGPPPGSEQQQQQQQDQSAGMRYQQVAVDQSPPWKLAAAQEPEFKPLYWKQLERGEMVHSLTCQRIDLNKISPQQLQQMIEQGLAEPFQPVDLSSPALLEALYTRQVGSDVDKMRDDDDTSSIVTSVVLTESREWETDLAALSHVLRAVVHTSLEEKEGGGETTTTCGGKMTTRSKKKQKTEKRPTMELLEADRGEENGDDEVALPLAGHLNDLMKFPTIWRYGDDVEVSWEGEWHAAQLMKPNGLNTWEVKYRSGETEEGVDKKLIRHPQQTTKNKGSSRNRGGRGSSGGGGGGSGGGGIGDGGVVVV
uniref:Uncharacterized protein n=1 Tax=Octactis speculum TaxID=3111310 RepID=A0A7S2DGC0_9STRA|mmetsp:Transcript_48570/g.66132  ORF Transcript_48570/g.66132 Transcript_48570/m.66132 type:complete len:437 (+) Transcript_48570:308-1618(+)